VTNTSDKKILVSGASIAGLTLAYWLHHAGFDVTVVERSHEVRSGGYPIDIRGTAMDVIERMGLAATLKAAHIDTKKITFIGGDGKAVGSIRPEYVTGGREGLDIEVPRGTLTAALYGLTRDKLTFMFSDSIQSLSDGAAGVDVGFRSGAEGRYDLVLAADGMHSNTRALVFGPEEKFHHYLGYYFAGFEVPNDIGLRQEGLTYNVPGRMATLYAAGGSDRLHALLALARPEMPSKTVMENVDLQRASMAKAFRDDGWQVPNMLVHMARADDFYFDLISQIRMPNWTSGRVAVVGDAAHAPSFLSGQGTSTALVSAYVLAHEIAHGTNPDKPFGDYEGIARTFIEKNQGTAIGGGAAMIPGTRKQLWLRNRMIGFAPVLGKLGLLGGSARKIHSSLELP